jgi:hypothetical protein
MAADGMTAALPRGAEKVGPLEAPLGLRAMLGVLMAIGAVTFITEVRSDPTQAYAAFLINHFVFMGLALGGVFFTALHHLAGSTWSVVVRRVAEAFASCLPLALITFLVIAFGVPFLAKPGITQIYSWTGSEVVQGEGAGHITKGGWLTPQFFIIRNLGALAIWLFFAWRFNSNSLRQDTERGSELSRANLRLAPAFILLFAFTLTLAAFDLLMSLEPTWSSTIFGVYCFAGIWESGLAAITIVTILLRRQGALDGIVTRAHYHDLGKYLFAFSIFWAYIAFSQFMLIWYANLTDEIGWLIHRTFTGWGIVGIVMATLRFGIPFFVLMPQKWKENETILLAVGVGILVGQWLDIYWVVMPALSQESVVLGWTEIGLTLGFIGLYGWWLLSFLARHPVAPSGDPLYASSVRFHG